MKKMVIVIMAILLCSPSAWAVSVGDAVEVRIVTDDGRMLPTYPVKMRHGIRKAYTEAIKGDHYRIEVTNRLNRRVGLVIAVDGRNIISGSKSWLTSSERMYILEPYGSGEFAGWRTSQNHINRFYFTNVPDSYAMAFGDGSAMGVIAIAVYPEVQRYRPPISFSQRYPFGYEGKASGDKGKAEPAPSASSERRQKRADKLQSEMESAGTGYGHDEYSPSRTVTFAPEKRAIETIYLKYEWRSTLCRLRVIECDRPHYKTPNRLWDNEGYAPPPPVSVRRR